ncbi:MAG TPA: GNAT family N-acetyltransferase [Gaiellaceae bacterium]|nr:GNAT family N-acetyltransferase [Gaiellaceae bacterium]
MIALRAATDADVEHLKRALFEAVAWNPERELPPYELVIAHPELARYHEGWGRPGDLAVVAESNGDVVGASLCRLFTADDHGHGYVDDQTPELAVAVWEGKRGEGIGTRLMAALEEAARGAGFSRLSLSVDSDNPARHLYERLGYEELTVDDEGVRMLKELG